MRWTRRKKSAAYSVIGVATDDGSTFVPAVTLTGDVGHLLAMPQVPGSVLYLVNDAPSADAATNRALEHFESDAATTAEFWERGEVFRI